MYESHYFNIFFFHIILWYSEILTLGIFTGTLYIYIYKYGYLYMGPIYYIKYICTYIRTNIMYTITIYKYIYMYNVASV